MIYRTLVKQQLHPNQSEIGPNPFCFLCNSSTCYLLIITYYIHLYRIPLCQDKPSREVVKCMHCETMYEREAYQMSLMSFYARQIYTQVPNAQFFPTGAAFEKKKKAKRKKNPVARVINQVHDLLQRDEQDQKTFEDPLYDRIVIEAETMEGDLNSLLELIDSYRSRSWEIRVYYLSLMVNSWGSRDPRRLLERCPNNAIGNLFAGLCSVHRAWDIKENDGVKILPGETASTFNKCLSNAGKYLLRCAHQDQEDPTPYSILCGPVTIGLKIPLSVSKKWFDAAVERDPCNYRAYWGYLQNMCIKSGGSNEKMYQFARKSIQQLPKESTTRVVLLQAFTEHYMQLNSCSKDKLDAKRLLENPILQQEVYNIYSESIRPHQIQHPSELTIHLETAICLFRLGRYNIMDEELIKLHPWRRFFQDKTVHRLMEERRKILLTNSSSSEFVLSPKCFLFFK